MTDFSDATLSRIRCAAEIIRGSKNTVVLTGAGISTPSGIPDFRSPTGLWNLVDPMEVASLMTFRYDPTAFFNQLRPLAKKVYGANPNAAHFALAKMEATGYIQAIITQNVDNLHQESGSKNVIEVHGTLRSLTCASCYNNYDAEAYVDAYLENSEVPICPSCMGVLKPNVVLMGEQLPAKVWLKSLQASRNCDLMIVAGSSLEVLPVAGLPMRALENGAHLILINHSQTYLDVRADVVLHEGVEDILPRIAEEVLSE
jgi:NAD-dependent deacetylase